MNEHSKTIQVNGIEYIAADAIIYETEDYKKHFIGKYCIVRCRDAGVHSGIVMAIEGRACLLREARRLWYWKNKKGDFLSSLSIHGVHDDSKIGESLQYILLTEDCEIIICTKEAEASIRNAKAHNLEDE